MLTDDTFTGILDDTKYLTTPISHRAKANYSFVRPIVLLLLLALASPFLVTSVLPQDAPVNPLSDPYTAQTYAPLDFPAPPYVEPTEPRKADVATERASRAPAQTERKTVSKVEIVISFALAQQGKRYSFGSKGPSSYDCSGLVLRAFAQIGITLYHYTGEMMKSGQSVKRASLLRGDIVFPSTGHVGIYLGSNMFVHASSGQGRVAVTKLYSFYTARRLV